MPSKQLTFRCFCDMCKHKSGYIAGGATFLGQEILSIQKPFHDAKCAVWKNQASAADALAQRLGDLTIPSESSKVTSKSWSSRNDAKDGPETSDRSLPALLRAPETPTEGGAKDKTSITIAKQLLAKVEPREANHVTKKHLDLLNSIEADLQTILSDLPDPKKGIRPANVEDLLDRSELTLYHSRATVSQVTHETNLLTQRKEALSAVLNQVEQHLTNWRNVVPSPSVYDCSEHSNFPVFCTFPINLYLEVTCSTRVLTRCPPPTKLLLS